MQTLFHTYYTALKLNSLQDEDRLLPVYSDGNIKVYPYQVAAALFAMRNPYQKGVILCDEAEMGKSHETMLAASEMWCEGKTKILIAIPHFNLLMQWAEMLEDKYSVPYCVAQNESISDFDGIVLTTNDYLVQNIFEFDKINWDAVIFEAASLVVNYDLLYNTLKMEQRIDRIHRIGQLRFIFSHSALKEGWDNPNVFQVCTLIEQKSTFTCRQKVGIGLRLCVNQDGERIEDKNINVLHAMANESFSEFAETLQKEIETETGVKFGVLQISLFSGMKYNDTVIEETQVSEDEAVKIIDELQKQGVIDQNGIRNVECKVENVEIKDENISTLYIGK